MSFIFSVFFSQNWNMKINKRGLNIRGIPCCYVLHYFFVFKEKDLAGVLRQKVNKNFCVRLKLEIDLHL